MRILQPTDLWRICVIKPTWLNLANIQGSRPGMGIRLTRWAMRHQSTQQQGIDENSMFRCSAPRNTSSHLHYSLKMHPHSLQSQPTMNENQRIIIHIMVQPLPFPHQWKEGFIYSELKEVTKPEILNIYGWAMSL